MTVIAVKKTNKGFKFASDSQVTRGKKKYAMKEFGFNNVVQKGKIFRVNKYVLGISGCLIDNAFAVELFSKKKHKKLSYEYLTIINKEIKELIYEDFKKLPSEQSYEFVISDGTRCFTCSDNNGVTEVLDYESIGSGCYEAKTAISLGLDIIDAVKKSIESCLYCGGEVNTMKINKK